VRLLYVACTRARDHLVVSLHRAGRKKPPAAGKRTNAELLVDGMGVRLAQIPDAAQVTEGARPLIENDPSAAPPPFRVWTRQREAALSLAARPTAIAATAMTDDGVADNSDADPGLQKRPRDMDLPPWLKGRYGTAVGRAVHGVLQTIDLATGDGLEAAVAAQCEAEAVPQRAADVTRLAQAALASPSVQEASHLPHWREVYVAAPLDDGRLLEGYIDLLYQRQDGLVIVDYKTASTTDPELLRHRVEGYRAQGTAYLQAVTLSTGQTVAATVFLFLTPTGGYEIHI
jgi:ATP-dependent helicase/nuclease subunit A